MLGKELRDALKSTMGLERWLTTKDIKSSMYTRVEIAPVQARSISNKNLKIVV